jgi:hypothetical protein
MGHHGRVEWEVQHGRHPTLVVITHLIDEPVLRDMLQAGHPQFVVNSGRTSLNRLHPDGVKLAGFQHPLGHPHGVVECLIST